MQASINPGSLSRFPPSDLYSHRSVCSGFPRNITTYAHDAIPQEQLAETFEELMSRAMLPLIALTARRYECSTAEHRTLPPNYASSNRINIKGCSFIQLRADFRILTTAHLF